MSEAMNNERIHPDLAKIDAEKRKRERLAKLPFSDRPAFTPRELEAILGAERQRIARFLRGVLIRENVVEAVEQGAYPR